MNETHAIGYVQTGEFTYCAVTDERILGVVYWSSAQPAEAVDRGGEPVVLDGDWFVVHGDRPKDHFALSIENRDEVQKALEWGSASIMQDGGS